MESNIKIKLLFVVLMTTLIMVKANPTSHSNYVTQEHQESDYETPEVIETNQSPLSNPQKTQEYQDFIKQLYRFDKEKSPPIQQEYPIDSYQNSYDPYQQYSQSGTHNIKKRAIVFRPLFVYKQQTIRKQKLKEQNKNRVAAATTTSPPPPAYPYVPANKSPTYVDSQNHIYQQYNPYYYPYQYGQRYPYQYKQTYPNQYEKSYPSYNYRN